MICAPLSARVVSPTAPAAAPPAYDAAVASWFAAAYAPDATASETGWPDVIGALWTRRDVLRYGENPHQGGALYTSGGAAGEAAAGGLAAGGIAAPEEAAGQALV